MAVPLRPHQPAELPVRGPAEIVAALLVYADMRNPFHDGFHLISAAGELTHVAMYFSPPVVRDLQTVELNYVHGGRYRAAQYGSCLPGVVVSGVLTATYGPVLFMGGNPHEVS